MDIEEIEIDDIESDLRQFCGSKNIPAPSKHDNFETLHRWLARVIAVMPQKENLAEKSVPQNPKNLAKRICYFEKRTEFLYFHALLIKVS